MWEVGRWSDGIFVAFNNSQLAKEKIEQFRLQLKDDNKQMWKELAEAGKYFAQAAILVAETTGTIKNDEKISTCTVEPSLSARHPIAYFPLSNPSFHFSVDYCCSNNSKCSASLS